MIFCISNGLVINPATSTFSVQDLWIEDGKIIEYASRIKDYSQASQEIYYFDATDKWVVPGLIDLHVHFREPGFTHKETIETGCSAARSGGFTTVCCMPNTNPVVDNGAAVRYITRLAERTSDVRVLPIGAITKGQKGKTLSDISDMALSGICAISEDGQTVRDEELMRQAMAVAVSLNLPVFSHAEPEEVIVERDIRLAEETGARLHFCHISTKGSVELIRAAKAKGLTITAETAPHYFALDDSRHAEYDANKKMNPPLRTIENMEAIRQALKEGIIDAIATDHAPHQEWEKALPYEDAPFGVIGLETSFAVSFTTLVKTGILTPMELIDKMSTQPAKIAGISGGDIGIGKPADITILDVKTFYKISALSFMSKSRNTPFNGMAVYGKSVAVILNGKLHKEALND